MAEGTPSVAARKRARHAEPVRGCAHTMENYKDAFYEPELSDNRPVENWEEQGSLTAEQRAHERWKQMLAEYEAPEIDAAVDEGMREFISRHKESAADQWY